MIKEWYQKFKIFCWYMLTEPFRQVKEIGIIFWNTIDMLSRTISWLYIVITLIIISLFYRQKIIAGIFLVIFFFLVLLWEWKRGYFMHRYRQKIYKNIKKELKEKEPEKIGGK